MPDPADPSALSPRDALQKLVEGNRRFLKRGAVLEARSFRAELAEKPQRPFAIVLGCSDSRTPSSRPSSTAARATRSLWP